MACNATGRRRITEQKNELSCQKVFKLLRFTVVCHQAKRERERHAENLSTTAALEVEAREENVDVAEHSPSKTLSSM